MQGGSRKGFSVVSATRQCLETKWQRDAASEWMDQSVSAVLQPAARQMAKFDVPAEILGLLPRYLVKQRTGCWQ